MGPMMSGVPKSEKNTSTPPSQAASCIRTALETQLDVGPRERDRAARALHERHESADEREQHQDPGVVRIGELDDEVVADQARRRRNRVPALQCENPDIDAEEKR